MTGEVLPDGQQGELVFTSLTKEAMPVVRYRTRDLTRLLPGTARAMRRIEKITGRSDDMIILRGVNVFPSQIEEKLFTLPALGPHYQIVLTKEGRMDQMEVRVEPRDPSVSAADVAAATKQLAHMIKANVGISTKITAEAMGAIERSQGKAVRTVDKRPKE